MRSKISNDILISRLKRQSLELEADLYGICYAFASFNSLPLPSDPIQFSGQINQPRNINTDLIFYSYGMASVLWTMEVIERISGIMTFGRRFAENDLISRDFAAQNFLLRNQHPCPIYRMNRLIMWSEKYELASNMVTPFFQNTITYLERIAADLHEDGIRPHLKWRRNSTELGEFLALF